MASLLNAKAPADEGQSLLVSLSPSPQDKVNAIGIIGMHDVKLVRNRKATKPAQTAYCQRSPNGSTLGPKTK